MLGPSSFSSSSSSSSSASVDLDLAVEEADYATARPDYDPMTLSWQTRQQINRVIGTAAATVLDPNTARSRTHSASSSSLLSTDTHSSTGNNETNNGGGRMLARLREIEQNVEKEQQEQELLYPPSQQQRPPPPPPPPPLPRFILPTYNYGNTSQKRGAMTAREFRDKKLTGKRWPTSAATKPSAPSYAYTQPFTQAELQSLAATINLTEYQQLSHSLPLQLPALKEELTKLDSMPSWVPLSVAQVERRLPALVVSRMRFNTSTDFVGHAVLHETMLHKPGFGFGNLTKFEKWAAKQQWTKFATVEYEPWMFPIDQRSRTEGQKFTVYDGDVWSLKKNDAFMTDYRRGIELVCLSWGWDVVKGKRIGGNKTALAATASSCGLSSKKLEKQQTWHHSETPLKYMAYSVRLFGQVWLFHSLQRFANLLLNFGVSLSAHTRAILDKSAIPPSLLNRNNFAYNFNQLAPNHQHPPPPKKNLNHLPPPAHTRWDKLRRFVQFDVSFKKSLHVTTADHGYNAEFDTAPDNRSAVAPPPPPPPTVTPHNPSHNNNDDSINPNHNDSQLELKAVFSLEPPQSGLRPRTAGKRRLFNYALGGLASVVNPNVHWRPQPPHPTLNVAMLPIPEDITSSAASYLSPRHSSHPRSLSLSTTNPQSSPPSNSINAHSAAPSTTAVASGHDVTLLLPSSISQPTTSTTLTTPKTHNGHRKQKSLGTLAASFLAHAPSD